MVCWMPSSKGRFGGAAAAAEQKKTNPAQSKAGVKSLLAKQYMALHALTDGGEGDPEMQAHLEHLASVLKADSETGAESDS